MIFFKEIVKIRQDIGFSRTKDHVVTVYTAKKLHWFNFQDKLTFQKFLKICAQFKTEVSNDLPVYIPTSFVSIYKVNRFFSVSFQVKVEGPEGQ